MSETSFATYEPTGRWRFDWMLPALLRPRRTFAQIGALDTAVSQTPLLILAATGLIRTLVAGGIRATAAANGQLQLPPGWEYYTPEQQAQFQQAMTATAGPVFTYLLPSVVTVLGVYLGWLVLGWLLHLLLTLLGGRSSSRQVLNVTAWSLLPFALRDVVRIVAMWNSGQLLSTLGLSGFAPPGEGLWFVFAAALLAAVDIYFFWHVILLGVGIRASDQLGRGKAWTAVFLVTLLLFLLRGVPALISAQLSDLTVIRPFF
ncbi:MAG: YIP1 family protein [Anaerolineales bacterium]|nr:YIP1 family protein [Anaerolineales bacterium]